MKNVIALSAIALIGNVEGNFLLNMFSSEP